MVMTTVAIVGAAGSLGQVMTPILANSDAVKEIRSISRRDLTFESPKIKNFMVDYTKPETLEPALKGVDVLINTMGTEGNYEQSKHALVDAAAASGVKFYIPSQFGVDVYHYSEAVDHPCWNGKKQDDEDARKKGLHVIPVIPGLFMEHPQGGFMAPHGFVWKEETWYMPGDGETPCTFTSKRDISYSVVEIIKMAMEDPSRIPKYIRIAGTNNTPKEIVEIMNRAAQGKTHLKLKLLSEKQADEFMRNLVWELPPGRETEYDTEYMNEVAGRVFKMSGGTGNLDFSKRNDNELVNPGQSKWKWKTMEEYAAEVDGMPGDHW